MKKVPLKELIVTLEKVLQALNYPEKQLSKISDVLLYALLRGNNQFIIQICAGNIPEYQATGDIKSIHETPISMRIDGQYNYGISVMHRSMRVAIDKAIKNGVGIVTSFKSASPGTAALGYYVEEIAKNKLIGFAFSGSSKMVAASKSTKPCFGANPLAIAFPTEKDPLVIDLATSESAVFKLVEAKLLGKTLDTEGFDENGNLTLDPNKVLQGALKTFGGHKGSALALAVEILTGPLTGASHFGNDQEMKNWGNLVLAIDPELVMDKSQFMKEISALCNELKAKNNMSLPGERAKQKMEDTIDQGYIEFDDQLFDLWDSALKQLI